MIDAGSAAVAVDAPAWLSWAAHGFAAFVVLASLACVPIADRWLKAVGPEEPVAPPAWDVVHVVFVALVFVLASLVLGAARAVFFPGEPSTLGLLVASALLQGLGAAVAVALAWALSGRSWRALGVGRSGGPFAAVRAWIAGTAVYAASLPAFLALGYLWQALLAWSGETELEQDLVLRFAALAPAERLWPVVLGVVVVPLLEETLFRAFVQPAFVKRLGTRGGIAATATLFGILHGGVAFVPIFALACVLGLVYARTRRLGVVWAIHALHNGLQFLLLYTVPELARP